MDLLCIAHDGYPYGHVTINRKGATPRQIGTITAIGEKEAAKLLAELEDAGVFSRTSDGTIYSRRMVRDAAAAEAGREAIGKRWEKRDNPTRDAAENEHSPSNTIPITNPIRGGNSLDTEAEAEAEAEAESESETSLRSPKKPDPRGSRLPDDWNPGEEGWQFAVDLGLNPKALFAEFRDYWRAVPGAKGRKLDWQATWRNRCRDVVGSRRKQSSPGLPFGLGNEPRGVNNPL